MSSTSMRWSILVVVVAFLSRTAGALDYQVSWFTIAAGAGTSTNGHYSVSGTIGQSDAGDALTGGSTSLTGGFWAVAAVPAGPLLTLTALTPNAATLQWTPDTGDYVLQVTESLSPAHWVNAPSGHANPIVVPLTSSERYFRVYKP